MFSETSALDGENNQWHGFQKILEATKLSGHRKVKVTESRELQFGVLRLSQMPLNSDRPAFCLLCQDHKFCH